MAGYSREYDKWQRTQDKRARRRGALCATGDDYDFTAALSTVNLNSKEVEAIATSDYKWGYSIVLEDMEYDATFCHSQRQKVSRRQEKRARSRGLKERKALEQARMEAIQELGWGEW